MPAPDDRDNDADVASPEWTDEALLRTLAARRLATAERRWRFLMIQFIVPAAIAFALIIVRTLIPSIYFDPGYPGKPLWMAVFDPFRFSILILGLFGTSAFFALMLYLQTGFRKDNALRRWIGEPTSVSDSFTTGSLAPPTSSSQDKTTSRLERDLATLQAEIRSLAARNATATAALSEVERRRLVAEVLSTVQHEGASKVLDEIRAEVARNSLAAIHEDTLKRLRSELEHLSYRGNLNLIIGILTTAIGISLLGFFVVRLPAIDPVKGNPWFYLADFLPRLSLVVLIEVFAYFFLRLYKAGLGEIKYFQNELTNVEARFLALRVAADRKDSKTLDAVILKWADTERNLLVKGETTVELERAKSQSQTITEVLKQAATIVKAATGASVGSKKKEKEP